MTRREIDKELRSIFSWSGDERPGTEAARKAFTRHMRGRRYGFDPLLDAWAWFRSGWQARGGTW